MLKKFGTDLIGILLITLAFLLGWLPGPGGIPLLILGLGLLSINHTWARRWLHAARTHGLSLSAKIFRDHPVWKFLIDIIGLVLSGLGIWLFVSVSRQLWYGAAFALTCLGLTLLLGNRKRIQHLKRILKA